MTRYDLRSVREIVDAVGAGNMNPHDPGPVVVEIGLKDGRLIKGSYCKLPDGKNADVFNHVLEVITDDKALEPFVRRLLESSAPFTTDVGDSESACSLKWTIGPQNPEERK